MTTPARPDLLRVVDVRLAGVRFRDERSRVPVPWQGSALDLVGGTHATRAEKRGAPAFSPVVYREGSTRGKRGIVHATALVFDFDHLSSEAVEEVY